MDRENILYKIQCILADQCSVEVSTGSVLMSTDLRVFYFDSLDIVEIAMSIEDEFGIEVEDHEVSAIRTVGDIVLGVEKLLSV